MVSLFVYLILGMVQGIFEWLPISSEGQIVVSGTWMGIDPTLAIRLAFWLHFGTMLSVLYIYRAKWVQIFNLENKEYDFLRKFLIITTIGTAVIGVPIKLILIDTVNWGLIIPIMLLLIAIALIITAVLLKYSNMTEGQQEITKLTNLQILAVGIAQGIAIIPGISRSGITVALLLFFQIEKSQSLEYSFHMSVIASLGAVVLDILDSLLHSQPLLAGLNVFGIFFGILLAFLLGILTMKVLIEFVRKYDFSIVAFALGILILLAAILYPLYFH